MFILQEMNNYETTRSDEFCEFDREIIQNTTQSCFTKSKKIYGSKTCNWLNSRDVSLFRNVVYTGIFIFFLNLPLVNGRKLYKGLIKKLSEGQPFFYNPSQLPCQFSLWVKPEYPEKTHNFRQSVDELFLIRYVLF